MKKDIKAEYERPKKCGDCGAGIIMVEYSLMDKYHYDGVSEYMCKKQCGWRIGRWCLEVLEAGEVEPRFCEGKLYGHPRIFNLEK